MSVDVEAAKAVAETLDFSDLEAKFRTEQTEDYDAFVVIDGTPIAPAAKVPALEKVLRKVLGAAAQIKNMHIPVDFSDKTMGYLFVECASGNDARALISTFHNKKFDKNHTFFIDKLSNVGKIATSDGPQKFEEPTLPEFKPQPHFRSWLTDSQARDQAAVHAGDLVSVKWVRRGGNVKACFDKERLTDSYIKWSPLGTYLLTMHQKGASLHAGPQFDLINTFPHRDVCFVDFSPNERYLVTGSRTPIAAPPEDQRANWPFKETDEGNNIVIWDTRTFVPLRSFPVSQLSLKAAKPVEATDPAVASTSSLVFKSLVEIERKRNIWPPFKWSHDARYFARIGAPDTLSIYETPSMALVEKRSLKVPGIMDFEFAPALVQNKHMLSYWTPEMPNQTARVCVIDVATKVTVRNRSLFNVAGCKIYWQSEAKYMCVKVDRYSKNKKTCSSSLDIWRLNEKAIGVDVVDLKEVVMTLAWEPNSDRFACYLYHDLPNTPISNSKNVLAFFAHERKKKKEGTWKEAYRFEGRVANSIHWNPRGRFLATLLKDPSKTVVEFWDMDSDAPKVEFAGVAPSMSTKEHHKDTSKDLPINLRLLNAKDESFGITDADWDPSGRQFVTWTSLGRGASPGYRLWAITGELELVETKNDKFKAFLWRPRPASILSDADREAVRKEQKVWTEKFDLEDKMRANEDNEELQRKRSDAVFQWATFRAKMVPALLQSGHVPFVYKFEVVDGVRKLVRREILEQEEKKA